MHDCLGFLCGDVKLPKNLSRIREKGIGAIVALLALTGALLVLLVLSVGFFEARKAYWDYRVSQMCTANGGISVIEKVTITIDSDDYRKLVGKGEEVSLPITLAAAEAKGLPYYVTLREEHVRERVPEIIRLETAVVRARDGRELGKLVSFIRRGGDFPTGISHGSSFICPKNAELYRAVFQVSGATK